ncbi:hypothetical protein ACFWAN_48665 [Streptomyces mirabilis]|uniref:hypothetical protein n=1 Tax=Streptomyces mirabilis TaxID=68239 RepID=UPI0036589E4B
MNWKPSKRLLGLGIASALSVGTILAVPTAAQASPSVGIGSCLAGEWCVNLNNNYTGIIVASTGTWANFPIEATIKSCANDTNLDLELFGIGTHITCPAHTHRNGFSLYFKQGTAKKL